MASEPRPEVIAMSEKIKGEGAINMNLDESNALRAMVKALLRDLITAQGLNLGFCQALQKHGLRLTHDEHEDGSKTFDLENAPQPTTEKVN